MSFTKLRYHLVFATKGRRRCLHELERAFVWRELATITEDIGGYSIAAGGIEDHVHLLAAIPPTMALSDFVKQLKRRATMAIRKRFAHLKGFRWQKGYGGFTVSAREVGGLITYINNQAEHHALGTLREDVEAILESMEG